MKHKLVIAMTAATLFLVGCGQRQHTEQVTLVRIDTVKTANTCDILEFPARVQAAGEVHLAFKIPGTLQRIYVDDGAFVRQGELAVGMGILAAVLRCTAQGVVRVFFVQPVILIKNGYTRCLN